MHELTMTIDQLRARMLRADFSVFDCSRATGIHINSIYNIRLGKTATMRPRNQLKVEAYFREVDGQSGNKVISVEKI